MYKYGFAGTKLETVAYITAASRDARNNKSAADSNTSHAYDWLHRPKTFVITIGFLLREGCAFRE
jgi:hypothetical protein